MSDGFRASSFRTIVLCGEEVKVAMHQDRQPWIMISIVVFNPTNGGHTPACGRGLEFMWTGIRIHEQPAQLKRVAQQAQRVGARAARWCWRKAGKRGRDGAFQSVNEPSKTYHTLSRVTFSMSASPSAAVPAPPISVSTRLCNKANLIKGRLGDETQAKSTRSSIKTHLLQRFERVVALEHLANCTCSGVVKTVPTQAMSRIETRFGRLVSDLRRLKKVKFLQETRPT
jgi:hypothetical protein